MFITVYSVVVTGSELLGHQSTCHFQIIYCSCKEMFGVDLIVTVEKCVYDLKEGNAKSVCSRETVMEKCSKDTFSLRRQRRAGSLNLNLSCNNGTLLPTVSSSTKRGPPNVNMISGNSRNVMRDDYVKFQCEVFSNLAANVTWLLNGLPLTGQMADYRYSFLECRTILYIENVLSKDAGNYTCLVKNEIGQAMASSYLTVKAKYEGPYILDFGLEGKTGMQGIAGTSLNLTCRTQNTAVQNSFFKDGFLKREDRIRVTWYQIEDVEQNIKVAKLEIKNVTLADSGNYTCTSILHGIAKDKTFPLRIVCPPGTYHNSSGGLSSSFCVPCPRGWYQPHAGASVCKPCSKNNVSNKLNHTSRPAVGSTDCPPVDNPTDASNSKMEKGEQQSSHITSMEIAGIVCGSLVAVVILVLVSLCVVKKWKLLSSYKTRRASSNPNNLLSFPCEPPVADSDLNGLCEQGISSIQCSQIVKRPPEIDCKAMYDVFICYSNKDVTWVKGLLEELEKRGFVCCVDFKDFIPGAAIVENISQAIYCSRKTVAVLTPDFVNSEWCNHELQKALQRLHSHQVVPVMLRSCTVPLILQGTSYLDWENCHVKPNFWPMLEKALRLPSNNCINSVKNNSS